MIKVSIPGFGELKLSHAIFDYNGTLAVDGYLIDGLVSRLNHLAQQLTIHIVTGDGFGTAKEELSEVNCKLAILPAANQAQAKKAYILQLPTEETVAIGNGRNDQEMFQEARLSLAILGHEGTATEAIQNADVVLDIFSAIDLLENPRRLIATLRA